MCGRSVCCVKSVRAVMSLLLAWPWSNNVAVLLLLCYRLLWVIYPCCRWSNDTVRLELAHFRI